MATYGDNKPNQITRKHMRQAIIIQSPGEAASLSGNQKGFLPRREMTHGQRLQATLFPSPSSRGTQNPGIALSHPRNHNPRTLGLGQGSPAYETKTRYQGKPNQRINKRWDQRTKGLGTSLPPPPDPTTFANHNQRKQSNQKRTCTYLEEKLSRRSGSKEPVPWNLPSIRL